MTPSPQISWNHNQFLSLTSLFERITEDVCYWKHPLRNPVQPLLFGKNETAQPAHQTRLFPIPQIPYSLPTIPSSPELVPRPRTPSSSSLSQMLLGLLVPVIVTVSPTRTFLMTPKCSFPLLRLVALDWDTHCLILWRCLHAHKLPQGTIASYIVVQTLSSTLYI